MMMREIAGRSDIFETVADLDARALRSSTAISSSAPSFLPAWPIRHVRASVIASSAMLLPPRLLVVADDLRAAVPIEFGQRVGSRSLAGFDHAGHVIT